MLISEKEEQLLEYVRRYMQAAEACCAALRSASGLDITRVSHSERQAVLPRKGQVNGLTYGFHGRGCSFKTDTVTIDVDFDTTGGCNAVDVWRLRLFLEDNFPQGAYWTSQTIPEGLFRLVQQQHLHQVRREYDEHFYYLGAGPAVENEMKQPSF